MHMLALVILDSPRHYPPFLPYLFSMIQFSIDQSTPVLLCLRSGVGAPDKTARKGGLKIFNRYE